MKLSTVALMFTALTLAMVTLAIRVESRYHSQNQKLSRDVAKIWGQSHYQRSPELAAPDKGGETYLDTSEVQVELDLEQKRKGLFWFTTYLVKFEGNYRLTNPGDQTERLEFIFPLPTQDGVYSDFVVTQNGQPAEVRRGQNSTVRLPLVLEPGAATTVVVQYRSQGSQRWYYDATNSPSRNLQLTMTTNFDEIDFPDDSVSPLQRRTLENGGWTLTWSYENLLTGLRMGMICPKSSDPGPRVIDMVTFAPLGMALFYVMTCLAAWRFHYRLQPLHLALLGAGYFSFSLLLVYLSDLLPLGTAFAASGAIALGLNLSYAWRLSGSRFAVRGVGGSMLLYQVLFSAAFLVEGFRGLPLVALLVVTLLVVMQATVDRTIPGFQHAS